MRKLSDTKLKSTLAGSCALIALMSGHEAYAQVDEVIVSATRRDMSVQDVPINITALNGQALENAGINSGQDLLNLLPGVFASDQGGRSGLVNNISMRGLNANNPGTNNLFQNITEAPVSTYLNDTPLFVNLKLTDVERVEILRGPQGTLYGSGSVGGTIRYILNKPKINENEGRVSVSVSSPDNSDDYGHSVDGLVNVPISDNAALRLSAGFETIAGVTDMTGLARLDADGIPVAGAGGSIDPVSADDVDERTSAYIRAALLMTPNDNAEILLTAFHQEDEYDAESVRAITDVPSSDGPEYSNSMRAIAPGEVTADVLSMEATFDLGFASFTSVTSYTETEGTFINDVSGLYQTLDTSSGGIYYAGYPQIVAPSYIDQSSEVFSQEFRLVSNGDGNVDWVVGAFYKDETRDVSFRDTLLGYEEFLTPAGVAAVEAYLGAPLPAEFPNVAYAQDRSIGFEETAVFGELTYHMSDQWQITGGARAFWQDFSQDNRLRFRYFGLDQTVNTAEEFDDVLLKLNTSYDISENNMVYITMSEGFRHGGANAFPLTGPFAGDAALVKINPDEVTNTEIGLKGQSADGSLTYSMAVFKMEWEDVQLDTFLGPLSIPSAINGEEAETEGFEIEVTKQVTDNFRISAGYSYVDAALTENADLDGDGTDDAFSGEEMAGVSENTASIMLDYIQPLASGKNIVYHLDGSYRSDFKTTFNEAAGNYAELDGFSIFNASVSLESETVNYTLFVRNLGDEEGVTGAVNNRHALAPFASRAYTMYPRTVGFKMSYNF